MSLDAPISFSWIPVQADFSVLSMREKSRYLHANRHKFGEKSPQIQEETERCANGSHPHLLWITRAERAESRFSCTHAQKTHTTMAQTGRDGCRDRIPVWCPADSCSASCRVADTKLQRFLMYLAIRRASRHARIIPMARRQPPFADLARGAGRSSTRPRVCPLEGHAHRPEQKPHGYLRVGFGHDSSRRRDRAAGQTRPQLFVRL